MCPLHASRAPAAERTSRLRSSLALTSMNEAVDGSSSSKSEKQGVGAWSGLADGGTRNCWPEAWPQLPSDPDLAPDLLPDPDLAPDLQPDPGDPCLGESDCGMSKSLLVQPCC
jgi:hypothetical protein